MKAIRHKQSLKLEGNWRDQASKNATHKQERIRIHARVLTATILANHSLDAKYVTVGVRKQDNSKADEWLEGVL